MVLFRVFSIQQRVTSTCLIGCFLLIQSCSNSQVGKKLADSFESPRNSENIKKNYTKGKGKSDKSSIEKTVKLDTKTNKKSSYLESEVRSNKKKSRDLKDRKKLSYNPQPYRVIIKLFGANPSAPAEEVTDALRDAGVKFEIETIEQFNKTNIRNKSLLK